MHKTIAMIDTKRIFDFRILMAPESQVLGFMSMLMTFSILIGNTLRDSFGPFSIGEGHVKVFRTPRFCAVMFSVLFLIHPIAYAQSAARRPADFAGSQGITLRQAVEAALESNTGVQLSAEEERAARARSHEALSAWLPNVSGQASQVNTTVNLRARGIDFSKVPLPGFSNINPLVGPFNSFDVRAYLQQTLFNLAAIRQYQAARAAQRATSLEAERARREAVATVAALYYGVLQAAAHIDATQANIRLNESLLELAEHQKEAGTGTAVDVTRAQVQLAQQRQRLLSDQVGYEDAKLRLMKAMGKGVSGEVKLVDSLRVEETRRGGPLSVGEALAAAREQRVELEVQGAREQAARLQLSAVKGERWPTVGFVADYGVSGLAVNDSALPTRTYGVAATLPIFDGGRREGRIAEQAVRVRQETVRTTDVEQQVEVEVRLAVKTLESAREQVKVAAENVKLAETELELARDRFQEGVTNNIEVVNAQTALEQAQDRKVDALYLYNLARVNFHRALGQVEKIYQ